MSDDRELKFKITGDASGLVGASKQGSQALEGIAQTTKKDAGAQEEAGRATEKHGGHLRGLHRLFHALNEVVPGLGVAMQAAFSPIGAAISLGVMALKLFHEKLKEVNEEFKRLEEEAAKPVLHTMEALREGTVQWAVGMERLRERLDTAARAERSLKESMEETLQFMRAQAEEGAAIADAENKAEMESLEQAHSDGLMSDREYHQQRLELERAYQQKKRELKQQEEMLEILAERRAVEQAEMAQPELTAAAEAAETKKEEALVKLHSGRTRAEVDEEKKNADKALKEFEGAHDNETWRGLIGQFEAIGAGKTKEEAARLAGGNGMSFQEAGFDSYYAEWSRRKEAAQSAQAEWGRQPADQARREVEAERASHTAERAAKRAEENQDFTSRGTHDMERRRGVYDVHASGNAQISAEEAKVLNAQAHVIKSTAESRLQNMRALLNLHEQHHRDTLEDRRRIAKLEAQIRNAHNSGT